jgi:hypothetical protein
MIAATLPDSKHEGQPAPAEHPAPQIPREPPSLRSWDELRADARLLTPADVDSITAPAPPRPGCHRAWAWLAGRYPELASHSACPGGEPTPPPPLSQAEVARTIATLQHPRTGPALLDALANALADRLEDRVRQVLADDLPEAFDLLLSQRRTA